MKPPFRAAAALAILLLSAGRAHAQGEDALLLPRGVVEGGAGARFTHFSELFGSGRTALGAFFDTPLTAAGFGPPAGTADTLQRIFDATRARTGSGAFTVGAGDVSLGTYRVNVAAEQRTMPLSLRVGVTSWLTVGVMVPIEWRTTEVAGARTVDAGVGPNPDAAGNRSKLLAIDSSFGAFGGGTYLPLRDSPAGQELRRRYELLRGSSTDTLALPRRGINLTELQTLLAARTGSVYPFNNQPRLYYPGDVEVSARLRLLNTTGARFNPVRGGRGLRVAAEGTVRFPTGRGSALDSLIEVPTSSGSPGASGALYADLFRGRFWVSAAGRYSQFFARDVARSTWTPGLPFTALDDPALVSRKPGARLEVGFTPRYRLTDEISLGGRYALMHQAATTFSALPDSGLAYAGVESADAQTAQLAGFGVGYSTLAAYGAGRSRVPYEFSLLYETAVAGSGGAAAVSQLTVSGRVFVQAWGIKRIHKPRTDTAVARPVPASDTRPQVVRDSARPAPVTARPDSAAPRPGPPARVIPNPTTPPPSGNPPAPPPANPPSTSTPPPAETRVDRPDG
jgi:hypothetical protein